MPSVLTQLTPGMVADLKVKVSEVEFIDLSMKWCHHPMDGSQNVIRVGGEDASDKSGRSLVASNEVIAGKALPPARKKRRLVPWWRRNAVHHAGVKLANMRAAVTPLLGTPAKAAYWDNQWTPLAEHAEKLVDSNRKEFYGLRSVAIAAAITVPSLVGLNLSSTGGVLVRWLTFALSLIAALATAAVTLFKFPERWAMYRVLWSSLSTAAWELINSSPDDADAWARFVSATEAAKAAYEVTYNKAVIFAAEAMAKQ